MIVKIYKAGKSFKGLGQYLTHDVGAETCERVAWTHTLNCANDHVPSAIHEMYNTYLDAELLKEEAGIRKGGRALEKPVKHFSLNWHPEETPDQKHMIGAVESYLAHMGWQEGHQAVLSCHTDKPHAHVHVMLNAVHAESGCRLDDGLERRRSQAWAATYERETGRVYCEQRDAPVDEREPAPTRPAWMAMKEAALANDRIDAARGAAERAREAAETRIPTRSEEWKTLKDEQRQARTAFFEDGRDAFEDLRNAVFHEVREEFRDEWKAYFGARREGADAEALQQLKADLVARQGEVLHERRDAACEAFRETREQTYAGLLEAQRDERAELSARQSVGTNALSEMRADAANQNARGEADGPASADLHQAFHAAAAEIAGPQPVSAAANRDHPGDGSGDRPEDRPEDRPGVNDPDGPFAGSSPRVRDGADVVAGLGLGMMGGAAMLTERLFDGFLNDGPPPAARKPAADIPPEPPLANRFAAVAEAARRAAERDEEEARRNAWWDERRARGRD